jgi:hypothetical protein
MCEIKIAYKILVEKQQSKRTPGRPTCKCEDNIKIDLIEI